MSRIFGEIASMSLMASWLIVAVILFRGLMRNTPKWMICLLWGVVAVRLVIPIQVESRWSLIPTGMSKMSAVDGENTFITDKESKKGNGNRVSVNGGETQREKDKIPQFENIRPDFQRETVGSGRDKLEIPRSELKEEEKVVPHKIVHSLLNIASEEGQYPNAPNIEKSATAKKMPLQGIDSQKDVVAIIWILGSGILFVYGMIDFLRIKGRVAQSIRWKDNVYRCDEIDTPFILGIFKPRIYLPTGMEPGFYEGVLRHEQAHLKRRDHWWKPVGFGILCIHWMNPLCWISYLLFCRDVEFACDESVTRGLDRKGKADYCQTLLSCSSNQRRYLSVPVAFGEVGVKRRIKAVMNGKKSGLGAILAVIFLGGAVVLCFATSPKSEKNAQATAVSETSESQDHADVARNIFEQLAYENVQAKEREREALQEEWEKLVASHDFDAAYPGADDFENVFIRKASLVHNEDGAWEPNAAIIYVRKHKELADGEVLVRLPEDTVYGLTCLGSRAGWRNFYLMKEQDGKYYILEFYFDCRGKNQVELYYRIFDYYVSSSDWTPDTGQKIVDEDRFEASGDFSKEEFDRITEKTDRLLKKSELLIGNLDGTLRVGPENDYVRYNAEKLYESIMESE